MFIKIYNNQMNYFCRVGNQANVNLDNRLPGQKTPTSSSANNPHMNNFSIPSSPHTPGGKLILIRLIIRN